MDCLEWLNFFWTLDHLLPKKWESWLYCLKAVCNLSCLACTQAALNQVHTLSMSGIYPSSSVCDQILRCLIATLCMVSKRLTGVERYYNYIGNLDCCQDMLHYVTTSFIIAYNRDVPLTFQDNLACCLDALFCPVVRNHTVMKRFWDHISSCLHLVLLSGAYPMLSCQLQVSGTSVIRRKWDWNLVG